MTHKSTTNRDVDTHFAGKMITIPKGSDVHLVGGLQSAKFPGWVVSDVQLLIKLTGNAPDPMYRYCEIPSWCVTLMRPAPEEKSEKPQPFPHVSLRESAAILAGLRLIQRELPRGQFLPQGVHEIYEDAGEGLSDDEIDALCERLN